MSASPANPQPSRMFSEPPVERGFPKTAVAIAAVAVLILIVVLVMLSRRPAAPLNNAQQAAAYEPHLVISGIEMSESGSLSGGKSTYIDGRIKNNGSATITGITLHVAFHNEVGTPPQVMIEPMMLIRTHKPYIDTEPMGAEPLTPGAEREFRLTFENVDPNWNQQPPEIHVSGIQTR
jgi:hypothetical protein